MVYFKNYSFEYNAKSVDIFKSTIVCSYATDVDNFKEGCLLDIETASFYGIITNSDASKNKLTIAITAESYARELRNNLITEETLFRQTNAIELIKSYLLPDGWEFNYPEVFDTHPRYISYSLRNGSYISHISTILQTLGLDYTIYATKSGGTYTKTIDAYFRDDFSDLPFEILEEWKDVANVSIAVDYGKIATSIVVMGAESDIGINQVVMDAEMGDWSVVPRITEIKDTQLKKPEMSDTSPYFWYYQASQDDYSIDAILPGDLVQINDEIMKIHSTWFLPGYRVASWENGDITDDTLNEHLQSLASYSSDGVVVASIDFNATEWVESVQYSIDFENKRNINAYGTESALHALYDPVLLLNCMISVSSYLTFDKNLPSETGFFWIGSERMFYRVSSDNSTDVTSYYGIQRIIRGVPTCATASCEHCGTRNGHLGWTTGCPYGGADANEEISSFCELAAQIETTGIEFIHSDIITNSGTACPVCFDAESVCPLLACKNIKNDTQFAELCPKGLKPSEIQWTEKYVHHKNSIVFPDSYYYLDDGTDVYETYARDSLIHRYGYIPTQVQVKGISDTDGLDKSAEGYLRLSALPVTVTFTVLSYDPWTVPAGVFPGRVVQLNVSSMNRYDLNDECWYPTHWFDYASSVEEIAGDTSDWIELPENSDTWYKIKQKFVVNSVRKSQTGPPEVTLGTAGTDFKSVMEYLQDSKDTTSQRHRNQELSKTINTSENGYAAQVQNVKTGAKTWVRMVR